MQIRKGTRVKVVADTVFNNGRHVGKSGVVSNVARDKAFPYRFTVLLDDDCFSLAFKADELEREDGK